MATCSCPMPIPLRSRSGAPTLWHCSTCGRDIRAPDPRDAEIAALRDERDKALAWMHRLTDRLDEVLSTTRWDNHDNWCPAATDAFLPYKQNADTPPECNCVIRDGWRDVEGARKVLDDKKGGG